jgi:hypothetical protein|tara:strand:+ start:279 stop:473 length:195 start_codon:yes stop_codon:yes gene_type:complete
MVKGFLSLRNAAFIEKNISTEPESRRELIEMGYDSTPLTLIGKRQISGFDPELIDAALSEVCTD